MVSHHEKILIRPHPDVEDLLPGYLKKRKSELLILKDALKKSDFATIATVCHNIKGTAESYGVGLLGTLALEVEKGAKAKSLDSVVKSLAEYEEVLNSIELAPTT